MSHGKQADDRDRPSLRKYVKSRAPAAVAFVYGILWFSILALRALIQGLITKRPTKQFWKQLAAERIRYWDLSAPHPSGLHHTFHILKDGKKLHYLTNHVEYVLHTSAKKYSETPMVHPHYHSKSSKAPNLVIFLHGWPDTSALWGRVVSCLPHQLTSETTIIAVDLPGFGGSDGLGRYGPNEMLSVISEFVCDMREKFLCSYENWTRTPYLNSSGRGKILIVGHDWGALIGFRLAADAPQIADHFILSNSGLPVLALHNMQHGFDEFRKQILDCTRPPLHLSRFLAAFKPLSPVIKQFQRSSYIFIFNLPWPLARASVTKCNLWALRVVNSIALRFKSIMDTPAVISNIASSLGPETAACKTITPDDHRYGLSVHQRTQGNGFPAETIRVYREGLATEPWKISADIRTRLEKLDLYNRDVRGQTASKLPSNWVNGAPRAPTTVVWGQQDPALDSRIMIDDVEDLLPHGSRVIRLPRIGHWVPIEPEGAAAMAVVVESVLRDENDVAFTSRVQGACQTAVFTFSSRTRRDS